MPNDSNIPDKVKLTKELSKMSSVSLGDNNTNTNGAAIRRVYSSESMDVNDLESEESSTAAENPTNNSTTPNMVMMSPSTGTTTMLLIQPHSAAKVIKGEIHNVLTVMRADVRYASQLRFVEEMIEDQLHPLITNLRELHSTLTDWEEKNHRTLVQPDAMLYLPPFCDAISGREISASVTGAALAALHKFLLYGFILPESPSAGEGMTLIANSLLSCTFEESAADGTGSAVTGGATGGASASTLDKKATTAGSTRRVISTTIMNDDEQVVLKLLELSALVVRCSLLSTPLIEPELVVGLLDTCLHVSHRAKKASFLLKSAAADALGQIVLQVFAGSGDELLKARAQILAKLASLLNPQQHSDATCATSLTLVNIAFETCRENFTDYEIDLLQNELCKYLLQWTTTHDLVILSLTLRVIFNLFQSIRNHLKVPLEIFLTSVHLRILDPTSSASNEEREVALESLLEFCQEPSVIQDIYLNYDCDVQCTNLFQMISVALGKASTFYDITTGAGAAVLSAQIAAKIAAQTAAAQAAALAEQQHQQMVEASTSGASKNSSTSLTAYSSTNTNTNNPPNNNPTPLQQHLMNNDISSSSASVSTISRSVASGGGAGRHRRSFILNNFHPYSSHPEKQPEPHHKHYAILSPVMNNHNHPTNTAIAPNPHGITSYHTNPHKDHVVGSLPPTAPHIPLSILNCLALEGVLAILDSIARRCKAQMLYEQLLEQGSETSENNNNNNNNSTNKEDDNKSEDGSYDSRWTSPIDETTENQLQKRKRKKQMLSKVASTFNNAESVKSKEWLEIALEENIISSITNPQLVAELLYTTPSLDKTKIGEYISIGPAHKYPFEQEVRNKFIERFDFSDMTFSTALRKFLSKFRLPGEAQCIDRLMEAFSKEYYKQKKEKMEQQLQQQTDSDSDDEEEKEDENPTKEKMIFRSADAVYVLSFSTIMLNTDLHNKNLRNDQRMTLQQFIRNNRGINEGEDLPEDFLTELYKQIKTKEIQVRTELGEFLSRSSVHFEDFRSSWDGLLAQKTNEVETAFFTTPDAARDNQAIVRASVHDREMFHVVAKSAIQCFSTVFIRSFNDILVYRALNGLKSMVQMCDFFDMDDILNEIIQSLLFFGREYILGCIALEYAGYETGTPILCNGKLYNLNDDNEMTANGATSSAASNANVDVSAFLDTESPMPVNLLLTKGGGGAGTNAFSADDWMENTTTSANANAKKKGNTKEAEAEATTKSKSETKSSTKAVDKIPEAVALTKNDDSSENHDDNINSSSDLTGCAAFRGLLALDLGFVLVQKNAARVKEAWPSYMECICALRDARGLPAGLSDLDDFADSNGNVLPLSPFAQKSQRRLDAYYRSIYFRDDKKNNAWFPKSTFGRFWGGGGGNRNKQPTKQGNKPLSSSASTRSNDGSRAGRRGGGSSVGSGPRSRGEEDKGGDDDDSTIATATGDDNLRPKGELSFFSRTLLSVAEAAEVEKVVQMGSTKLPSSEYTIRALLDAVDGFPYDHDPVLEQHAIFSLELAARALLSNRRKAPELFSLFLAKFESILSRIDDNYIPAPFVIERIVVTVLRSSIHLYDHPELRASLRSSLHLLMMALPRSFIRQISDRMACGLAIILRASFQHFETANEWAFMGDTLDMLANYGPARGFIFDGIASTVEYAIGSQDDEEEDDEEEEAEEEGEDESEEETGKLEVSENTASGRARDDDSNASSSEGAGEFTSERTQTETEESEEEEEPTLTMAACTAVTRVLIRFVLGFYQGDLSLSVPAMLCLEKVYRHTVKLLLEQEEEENPGNNTKADPMSAVPDKELWQNVAVAIYSVCRSVDKETSRHGTECYERLMMSTAIESIPDDKWIAILYLMVNKQPPLVAKISRANTFSVLGKLVTRLVPVLSDTAENWDDLADLMTQIASLAEENLREGRKGSVSQLFKRTVETVTSLSNEMMEESFGGSKEFNSWASETLFAELEKVGAGGGSIRNQAGTKKSEAPHLGLKEGHEGSHKTFAKAGRTTEESSGSSDDESSDSSSEDGSSSSED